MYPPFSIKPIISINGSLGRDIVNKILDENVMVEIDFKLLQKAKSVESYNVIGRIDVGADKTIVIGAHYDSWWCGGAVDDASGVGLLMGLAKWFGERKDAMNLRYNLEFVAFGGEEYGTRGSAYYAHTTNII